MIRAGSILILIGLLIFMPACNTINAKKGAIGDEKFDARGVKLHYLVVGKGEPVLLIHGFTSSVALNWQLPGIINLLSKNYQVIALDMPGHGLSDKPTDRDAYGLQLVEDVIRLLDHLKVKKAHIVGYSMGGMI